MSAKRCPICGAQLLSAEFKPFCSKRCADIDLSRWLKGSYAIPGAAADAAEETPTRPANDEE